MFLNTRHRRCWRCVGSAAARFGLAGSGAGPGFASRTLGNNANRCVSRRAGLCVANCGQQCESVRFAPGRALRRELWATMRIGAFRAIAPGPSMPARAAASERPQAEYGRGWFMGELRPSWRPRSPIKALGFLPIINLATSAARVCRPRPRSLHAHDLDL